MSYHALPLDLTVPQLRKLMTGKGIIIKPKNLVGSGFGKAGNEPSRGIVVQLLPHQARSLVNAKKGVRLAFTPEQIQYHALHGGGIFGDIWNKVKSVGKAVYNEATKPENLKKAANMALDYAKQKNYL